MKVGTIIEIDGVNLIFLGYENRYIYDFYEYSPDMLRGYDRSKIWRLSKGFTYKPVKKLDATRLRAWMIKNKISLTEKAEKLKKIDEKELKVYDVFLAGVDLYCYMGKTFSNHYIVLHKGTVEKEKRVNQITKADIEVYESLEEIFYVRRLTKEEVKELLKIPYGEALER